MRLRIGARLQQVLHGGQPAAAAQRIQVHLLEQIALRMAAADAGQAGQGQRQLVGGIGPLAAGMGAQATGGRHSDLLPGGAGRSGRHRRKGLDVGQQLVGLRQAGTCQAVQVLQVEEGLHLVGHPRQQPGRQLGPAVAHRHTSQFQPGQQRHGAHLVLRIGLVDAPDLPVVERQRRGVVAQLDVEQRQVPPQVAAHEGGQALPALAEALQLGGAFGQPAVGQHHMGQRMLGPGLGRLHRQCAAGAVLGLVEPVALLPAEGQQAVQRGHVGGGGFRMQRQAQHGR